MKNRLLIAGFLVCCIAFVYCIQPAKPKAVKPNVIFILTDQWRAEATGYAGNKDVKTPHIDKLASQSAVFRTAVATMPVCTPYRGCLLTGQYPLKHGLFYNDKPLANEALTMGEIYKENGYRTGYIGKWHVNGHKNGEAAFAARDRPVPKDRRQGFDFWKVREVSHDYNDSFYFDENDKKHTWPGYDAFPQTDSAIGFIKRSKDPFLLVLSVGPPHNPYNTAPEKYRKMYDPATLKVRPNVPEEMQDSARKVLAQYYAHCTALDDMVGKLMKTLDDQGIAENTIVVFTSDHGDMLLTKGVFRKQRPWDESILVPMLIRYPQKLGKKSIEISKPIGTPDILPTLLGLSDIKIPGSIDGTDVSPGILQPAKYPIDASLIMLAVPFHEYNFSNGGREYRGIRTERITYVRRLNGPWLLYDNKTDPYQLNNLVNKPAFKDLQANLEAKLSDRLRKNNDQFLPADEYMKLWNYNYDNKDSLRPQSYYSELGKAVGSKAAKPNIIFLLTDDHRWDALGAMGNKIIHTPNLDALANSGILFKKAYVTTAICCVSRASIMSGQYESRHRINDFTTDFSADALSKTYPILLKKAGYKIGFIGKLGIDVKNQPDSLFDYWSSPKEGQPIYELINKSGKMVHHTDSVNTDIKQFLTQYANKEPFCLSVSFKAPHELDGNPPLYPVQARFKDLYKNVAIPEPVTADPKYWESFPDFFRTDQNIGRDRWKPLLSTPELRQKTTRDYYRLITGVDEVVGDLTAQLQQLNIADNTIIIFMGDNGFSLGEHGLEGKWFGFEESIRVPMIISGARLPKTLRGLKSDQIALNIDVAPTILSLAGVKSPETMQGKDLIAALNAKKETRSDFFYEHTYMGSPRLPKVEGVVGKDFKYMKYIEHGYEELYNTTKDQHETTNLAKSPANQKKLEELRVRYNQLKKEVQ